LPRLRLMRPVRHTSMTPNFDITFCIATVWGVAEAGVGKGQGGRSGAQ
jgi:hypothetical protein